MKARELIEGAANGSESRGVMLQAFDQAWVALGQPTDNDARVHLAHVVIAHARQHGADALALANAAIKAFRAPPKSSS